MEVPPLSKSAKAALEQSRPPFLGGERRPEHGEPPLERGRIELEDSGFRPARQAPVFAPDKRAWLIEKMGTKDRGPSWISLEPVDEMAAALDMRAGWQWTSDAQKVFRCAGKEDAERLASFLGLDRFSDVSAVEHIWSD